MTTSAADNGPAAAAALPGGIAPGRMLLARGRGGGRRPKDEEKGAESGRRLLRRGRTGHTQP